MEHSQVNTSINKPQDTQGASPSAEFDQFAVDYNAGMENSVKKLVGDNPDIFIEVKARWLLANLAKPDARTKLAATPARLLDFGCGAGLFLQVLRRLGFAGVLHGCDISSGMLAEAMHTWSERQVIARYLTPRWRVCSSPVAAAMYLNTILTIR